jgi:hypothetical protein
LAVDTHSAKQEQDSAAATAAAMSDNDDDDDEKVEGLEAGEAAALSKRKRISPKPIECCITLNRYFELCAPYT